MPVEEQENSELDIETHILEESDEYINALKILEETQSMACFHGKEKLLEIRYRMIFWAALESCNVTESRLGRIDRSEYKIPKELIWQNQRWAFCFAIIQSGSIERGHFKALVRISDDEMRIYDDDSISKLTHREALARMRRNKYGIVYGLMYERL